MRELVWQYPVMATSTWCSCRVDSILHSCCRLYKVQTSCWLSKVNPMMLCVYNWTRRVNPSIFAQLLCTLFSAMNIISPCLIFHLRKIIRLFHPCTVGLQFSFYEARSESRHFLFVHPPFSLTPPTLILYPCLKNISVDEVAIPVMPASRGWQNRKHSHLLCPKHHSLRWMF